MSDDVVGVIADENLDEDQQGLGPTGDELAEEGELVDIDDLDVLPDDVAHGLEDEGFLFEEDELVGTKKKKSDPAVADEFAVEEVVGEEDPDDEEDFYGDEDDEARYNYRAEEDVLDDGF